MEQFTCCPYVLNQLNLSSNAVRSTNINEIFISLHVQLQFVLILFVRILEYRTSHVSVYAFVYASDQEVIIPGITTNGKMDCEKGRTRRNIGINSKRGKNHSSC